MNYSKDYIKGFFDKLIQLQIFIPAWSEKAIEQLISDLINQFPKREKDEIIKYSNLITEAMLPNPRKVKRLINSFIFLNNLNNEAFEPGPLLSFLILQNKWPEFYNRIRAEGEAFFGNVHRYIINPNDKENNPIASYLKSDISLLRFLRLENNPIWHIHHLDIYLYYSKILTFSDSKEIGNEESLDIILKQQLLNGNITRFNRIRRSNQWKEVAFENLTLSELPLKGISFAKVQILNSTIDDCSFEGSDLMLTSFKNCKFRKVDFSNVNLTNSQTINSSFDECTFYNSDLSNISIDKESTFLNCKYNDSTIFKGIETENIERIKNTAPNILYK